MKLDDLPQFPTAAYEVDVSWDYLEDWIALTNPPLNLDPDYQRGHVWTEAQQIAYVEFVLMRGETSRSIICNCPGWHGDMRGPYELVDGLQRITAVRRFMRDDIRAFGHLRSQLRGSFRLWARFAWRVMDLPTRADVLKLYLLLNSGGTPHSPEEIARVRELLAKEGTPP